MGKRGPIARSQVRHRAGEEPRRLVMTFTRGEAGAAGREHDTPIRLREQPSREQPVGHMAPAAGPRDETCAHYVTCLAAHVIGHPRCDPPASCPAGCRWREPIVEHATDYAIGAQGWDA